MKKILYLTDLAYKAKGRNYCDEDIFITNYLKDHFDVVLAHPKCSQSFENFVDLVVFRNTGSIMGFKDIYNSFVSRVANNNIPTFNSFSGKADMRGKQYLIELSKNGFPVIPTVDSLRDLCLLPVSPLYVAKPMDGADSIGLEFLSGDQLMNRNFPDGSMLLQPAVDFLYEVSFFFINDKFQYALYAPDKSKRWEMKEYICSQEDISFAERFIHWNSIKYGIQRVDACRTKSGDLLLVELEDLNPYLSLLSLCDNTRNAFLYDLVCALNSAMKQV